jgi:hypothetical protein
VNVLAPFQLLPLFRLEGDNVNRTIDILGKISAILENWILVSTL